MNAIFNGFSFSFQKEIVKKIIQKFDISNAHNISSTTGHFQKSEINNDVNIFNILTSDVYNGLFEGVNFNEIPPLDAEILADYIDIEAEIIQMMSRDNRFFNVLLNNNEPTRKEILDNKINSYYYTLIEEPTYYERKKIYLNQLRYWLYYIEKHNITLLFLPSPPHNNYEYIIYNIIKRKGGVCLFATYSIVPGSWFISHDFKIPIVTFEELNQTKKKYLTIDKINFGSKFSHEIKRLQTNAQKHVYHDDYYYHTKIKEIPDKIMQEEKKKVSEKSYPITLSKKQILKKIFSLDLEFNYFLFKYKSRNNWVNKLKEYYKRNTDVPDYNEKYFYFPLHMQPECTSAPLGGSYADQQLIVDIITYYLPDDTYLYIKEHPKQKHRWRSFEYYWFLKRNKRIKLISISENQSELIKNSLAVVTITGTTSVEGLFMGKPCIIFGHNSFSTASGVFKVTTREECRKAIELILNGFKPNPDDLIYYCKTLEEKAVFAATHMHDIVSINDFNAEKNADTLAEAFYVYFNKVKS